MFQNTHFSMALHVLTALAHRQGETLTSAALAESVGTNPAFLRALLGRLKTAGLIDITMGKGGGAFLARRPNQISLRDVYLAVHNGPAMHKHECDGRRCAVAQGMRPILDDLEDDLESVVQSRLARTSVADVLKDVQNRVR